MIESIHSWSFSEELINEEMIKGVEALCKGMVIAMDPRISELKPKDFNFKYCQND